MPEMPVTTALPKPGDGFLVFAHRGAMAYAPQNTLAAFFLAWKMGAPAIELDVQCARDGVPVVYHDDRLESLTDGKGPVREHDLGEILRLDAGSRFSPAFSGERIPTLEEVLRARPSGTFVNIEIKTEMKADSISRQLARPFLGHPKYSFDAPRERDEEARRIAVSTAECVRSVGRDDHELTERLLVSSFDPAALRAFGADFPGIPLAFLHSPATSVETDWVRDSLEFSAWHPYWNEVRGKEVAKAHARGQLVNCWTVNSRRVALNLASLGVDGIFTNRPDEMLEALAKSPQA
jgi:glycerophosphoryl diester phosphodiesterase